MTETGQRLARLVDDEAFTLAVAWVLVLVGAGGPLLAGCVNHVAAGRLLAGCAVGVAGLLLAGFSIWNVARSLRRARRAARMTGVATEA